MTGKLKVTAECPGCGLWLDYPIERTESSTWLACNCKPPRQRAIVERADGGLLVRFQERGEDDSRFPGFSDVARDKNGNAYGPVRFRDARQGVTFARKP